MTDTWVPDKNLLDLTIALGLENSAELTGEDDPDQLLLLCELAGILYYLGEEHRVKEWLLEKHTEAIKDAVRNWSEDSLYRAYIDFLKIAKPNLNVEDFTEVIDCLRERDIVNNAVRGATVITGMSVSLSEEMMDTITLFDNEIRKNLHFLIPINTIRQNKILWARPDRLTDFWWWSTGFELPQDALKSLFQASEIIQKFPGARDFFELLLQGSEQLDRILTKGVLK